MDDRTCHYVSRFATKAWEFADRRVWVYDFERRTFKKRSSKTLFARPGINSAKTEQRLDELIETPISNALTDGSLLSTEVDWKVRRAVVLGLLVQGARAGNALGPSPADFATVLDLPDDQIDAVVARELQEQAVGMIELPDSERLFYPQVGFFAFPVRDSGCATGLGFGFALPITPRRALVKFPTTADLEFIKAQVAMKHAFMGLSLGAAEHCKLVVVPPDVKEANQEPALVEAMAGLRACSKKLIDDVQSGRENVLAAWRKVGVDVVPAEHRRWFNTGR